MHAPWILLRQVIGNHRSGRRIRREELAGAELNTDRNLRLQYLAGEGLNVLAAAQIFAAMASSETGIPPKLFTGTPAQIEELRQRLAGRQGRY